MPSASPQECLGIILGAPGSSPAPEATLECGAPSKGSYTTVLRKCTRASAILAHPRAINFAVKHREVLIKGGVNPEAIIEVVEE